MSSRPTPLDAADPDKFFKPDEVANANDFYKPDEIDTAQVQDASSLPDENEPAIPVHTSDSNGDDPAAIKTDTPRPASPPVVAELPLPPQSPAIFASPLPLTPAAPTPLPQTTPTPQTTTSVNHHELPLSPNLARPVTPTTPSPSRNPTHPTSATTLRTATVHQASTHLTTHVTAAATPTEPTLKPTPTEPTPTEPTPTEPTLKPTPTEPIPTEPTPTEPTPTEPTPTEPTSDLAVVPQSSPSNSLSAAKSGSIHHTTSLSGSRPRTPTDQDSVNPIRAYDLHKHSMLDPQTIDISEPHTKRLIFRKIQHHSYSWGFHNAIVSVGPNGIDSRPKAEARRAAFQKPIQLSWIDPRTTLSANTDGPTQTSTTPANEVTSNTDFTKLTSSKLLFSYEFRYEGHLLRWTRASVLSHDMSCELVGRDSRTGKETLRIVAEFNSQAMGYLRYVGRLKVWESVFSVMEEPQGLEALLLLTCCTLIDLMREVVEKVVGIGGGGVAAS